NSVEGLSRTNYGDLLLLYLSTKFHLKESENNSVLYLYNSSLAIGYNGKYIGFVLDKENSSNYTISLLLNLFNSINSSLFTSPYKLQGNFWIEMPRFNISGEIYNKTVIIDIPGNITVKIPSFFYLYGKLDGHSYILESDNTFSLLLIHINGTTELMFGKETITNILSLAKAIL
ncbi:hypothetical protein, partial [Acidianus sp. RZ1]|uniref:hypothetical protein n=1 Tax=Acidianus sp. RZ1 TaxID=1540082 RepID=UPI0014911F4E